MANTHNRNLAVRIATLSGCVQYRGAESILQFTPVFMHGTCSGTRWLTLAITNRKGVRSELLVLAHLE